jgi:xylan 1,4-beta-xylosidase
MKVLINCDKTAGRIKLMNAVNNGPVYTKNADQNSGNLTAYTEANIPYARTHDASFFSRYGGEHTVDVHLIFRNFDADPYDPASYDFHLTDEYLETIMMAGTKVFYRLGSKIEHESKKYGTLPPKDFKKWAVICEHIIAHINEGWADGHHMGVEYWEIWNEPDLYGKCWGGTPEQFYELYAVASKHLKERFPHLKIGGPAVTGFNEKWLRPFLERVRDEKLPLDFYSWHRYAKNVIDVALDARRHRNLLDEYGLTDTESILNEWNYVRGWSNEDWTYSLNTMTSIKGAAFISAVMTACQNEPVDMLMYYDARPCGMNGLFSMYAYKILKGYYPIKVWGEMLKMGNVCETFCDIPDIYAIAAKDDSGKFITLLTYYSDNDSALPKVFDIEIKGTESQAYTLSLLDNENDLKDTAILCANDGRITITMKPNTVAVIK